MKTKPNFDGGNTAADVATPPGRAAIVPFGKYKDHAHRKFRVSSQATSAAH